MNINYVTLSLSDVTGKQTSSLVVETFDWIHVMNWIHVMTTAVERHGRMRQLVTFIRRHGSLQTLHKKLENNA